MWSVPWARVQLWKLPKLPGPRQVPRRLAAKAWSRPAEAEVEVCERFVAGRLKQFLNEWKQISHDPQVLNIVRGVKIEFDGIGEIVFPGVPGKQLYHIRVSPELDAVIQDFVDMKVICEMDESCRGYVSPIFTVPKKDGSLRMILNLKRFNVHVEYQHFKMDSLHSAVQLMRPDCFMASVDLKHAYYSVAMHQEDQKYLQFEYRGRLFQFTCLPMGIACAPRLFTKLCKPVYATLRRKGHIIVGYIDDSYLQSATFEECEENVKDVVDLFTKVGFVVNFDKSELIPCQKVEFLGFELDSVHMTVRVTVKKQRKILDLCVEIRSKSCVRIRELASLIGMFVSASNGVEYGPLFFKEIEIEKNEALKQQAGNFDGFMTVTDGIKGCLTWWIENLHTQVKRISHAEPDIVMFTDASNAGWGASTGTKSTNGQWNDLEKELQINCLELYAVLYGLRSLCADLAHVHVRVRVDNMTAVHYISNMGGVRSVRCNRIAKRIWLWCMHNNIWLSVAFIKGKDNVEADRLSRVFDERTEWMLNREVFQDLVLLWGRPEIDLFASRLNAQVAKFISWLPDPEAHGVDAFSLHWGGELFYAFPPFCQITKCVQKILFDRAEGILVVPAWTTQVWFSALGSILIDHPRLIRNAAEKVHLPGRTMSTHTLQSLQIMACLVSGNDCLSRTFRKRLPRSSWPPGGQVHKNSTGFTSKSGLSFVTNGKLIDCRFL